MANTTQGLLQKWLRSQTGKTKLTFEGDMLAYLKSLGYNTTRGYNGCLIKFLKTKLSLTVNQKLTLNDLQYRFAKSKGKRDWSGIVDLL